MAGRDDCCDNSRDGSGRRTKADVGFVVDMDLTSVAEQKANGGFTRTNRPAPSGGMDSSRYVGGSAD